jgi:hypothetical protein
VLTNVVISGNMATYEGGGMYNFDSSNPTICNSIIWGNTAQTGSNISNNSSTPVFSYSLIQGSGGSGSGSWAGSFGTDNGYNIDANPQFVAPATASAPTTTGDYRLQAGSPAIDSGNTALFDASATPDLSAITTDLDGNPRISGIGIDMGAYELPIYYTVTFSVTGSGGALGGMLGATTLTSPASVKAGQDIVFTATPAAGYRIKEWTVDGVAVSGHTTNTYTITGVAAAHTVTVEFEAIPTCVVTVSSAGTGASGGGNYAAGVTVTINAGTPPSGKQFKEWITTSAGVTLTNAGSATTTFTMPANNVTVTAVFEDTFIHPIQRYIVVLPSENGQVLSDRLLARTNETVTLTIQPDEGYELESITVSRWIQADVTVPVSGTGNTRTFAMPPYQVDVTAIFKPIGTSVADIQHPASLKAYTQNNILYVTLNPDRVQNPVRVYNILGTLVYQTPATGEKIEIPLPGRGVYIVTNGDEVIKVTN